MTPLNHLIHPFLIAFKNSLNTAIPAVFNPTLHPESKSRLLGVVAEEDSLNPSFNNDPCPYLFHIDLKTITRSS